MTAKKSKKTEIIRSSAAEYLTFIAASGESGVDVVYTDENIWLSQKMMGMLYNVETHAVNYHLKKIFSDNELDENSVIRKFRITAQDGKQYQTNHYNLSVELLWARRLQCFFPSIFLPTFMQVANILFYN